MEKAKSILEGLLYLAVIFMSQKIIGDLYSNLIFYLSSQENSFVSKMFFSKTLTLEEKAITVINQSQPIYIAIAWILGIGIILLSLKVSKHSGFPDFINKISLGNLLMSVLIGFGIVLLTNGMMTGLINYLPKSVLAENPRAPEASLVSFLVVGMAIPLLEEIVFRGYIMGRLYRSGTVAFAVVIQSLLFSLSHLDLFQGISVLLLGIGTGYVVLKTNSLLSGIIIHCIFNMTNLYINHVVEPFLDIGQIMVLSLSGLLLIMFGIQRLNTPIDT